MSMISEISAAYSAEKIKKMILKAEKDGIDSEFIRRYLYPLYKDELSEAWTLPDEELKRKYG